MAKFCENGNEWESFVWKPRKASCLRKDGSCDYEKLNQLITKAQQGDQEAKMLVFEQYAGVWQPLCSQSEEIMYRLAMDYEDFQSEAFISYLMSLNSFGNGKPEKYKEYLFSNCKNKMLDLFKKAEKQVVGHGILKKRTQDDNTSKYSYALCSLQVTTEDGNLKYDIPDTDAENEYFQDYYPQVSKLLTEKELQIAIDTHIHGYSLKKIAKKNNISYGRIRNILSDIKKKLKVLDK